MPSSLVFAALVVAWLAVLVPMVARRRQAVTRTAERELASRVVRRPAADRRADHVVAAQVDATQVDADQPEEEPDEEVDEVDTDREPALAAEPPTPPRWSPAPTADRPRPYRPGRGGFDPEAAALAARARYAFRQRVVLGLLAVAVLSVISAAVLAPAGLARLVWWLHGTVDVLLVGYLAYLRRQVRIEEEVRARRAVRMACAGHPGTAPAAPPAAVEEPAEPAEPHEPAEPDEPSAEQTPIPPVVRRAPEPGPPAGTVVIDSDDDPAFHDLDDRRLPPYRRAAGE